MKRFTTMKELRHSQLQGGVFGALRRALCGEQEIAGPDYNPDDDGSVWLIQKTDNDLSVAKTFGTPLMALPFEKILHHPEEEHFIAYVVRNNSRCDTLVIPDAENKPPEIVKSPTSLQMS